MKILELISPLLVGLTLLVSTSSMAENVKMKFTQKSFNFIEEDGLKIEQIQAKLRCHFVHMTRGNNQISGRYPFTRISYSENNQILNIKKSSLTEFMPNFDLINCSYLLVVLGRNNAGKLIGGDIALLGSLKSQMSSQELKFIQNLQNNCTASNNFVIRNIQWRCYSYSFSFKK